MRDFDQNGAFPVAGDVYSVADGWRGSGGGADPWEYEYYSETPSPAGGKYGQFSAVTPAPSWYLGATSFPLTGIQDLLITENVDSLYLNIFVMADEDLPNAGSQIGLQASSQTFLRLEDINWKGWKLLTYKLGDFARTSGAQLTTTNIDNFVLQLGAQPEQATELKVLYDFALITYGSPLFEE